MDELITGPELDRRVCEILGIEPDGGETFDPSDPVYPAVSTNPATIPMLMKAVCEREFIRQAEKWATEYGTTPRIGRDVQRNVITLKFLPNGASFRHWAQIGHEDNFASIGLLGRTENLALCGLAVKLGNQQKGASRE